MELFLRWNLLVFRIVQDFVQEASIEDLESHFVDKKCQMEKV